MSRRWVQMILLVAAGGFIATTPLLAQHRNGKAKGNPHANQGFDDKDRDNDEGWENRGDYEYRTYGERDGVPPGWSKGKKTGWGNCGLPPGRAKKYGCQSYRYQGAITTIIGMKLAASSFAAPVSTSMVESTVH